MNWKRTHIKRLPVMGNHGKRVILKDVPAVIVPSTGKPALNALTVLRVLYKQHPEERVTKAERRRVLKYGRV